jgi:arabinose-5-phosphate isomerase
MHDSDGRLGRMRATLLRESAILAHMASELDGSVARAVDMLLSTGGRVLIGGAGTSHAVAARFAHLLCCAGLPAFFVHPADALHGGSGAVCADDTVLLISKGGATYEVNRFAELVRQRGAGLIAMTEAPDSELGRLAGAVICVQVPCDSDPFGMVATSSSLANAAVADAICETILCERGYTAAEFASTHPGGAVGQRIRREGMAR